MEDPEREKPRQLHLIDKWLQAAKFRSGKFSFKSEVSHSAQRPGTALRCIGEVEDAKSIDNLDLITSPSVPGKPMLDFKICKRTQDDPNRKLKETSHHSSRQSSSREEVTHRQTDCLDYPRLLSKAVTTMKPSWTSAIYQKVQRATAFKLSTQSGSKYYQQPQTDLQTIYWRVCTRCKLKSRNN